MLEFVRNYKEQIRIGNTVVVIIVIVNIVCVLIKYF